MTKVQKLRCSLSSHALSVAPSSAPHHQRTGTSRVVPGRPESREPSQLPPPTPKEGKARGHPQSKNDNQPSVSVCLKKQCKQPCKTPPYLQVRRPMLCVVFQAIPPTEKDIIKDAARRRPVMTVSCLFCPGRFWELLPQGHIPSDARLPLLADTRTVPLEFLTAEADARFCSLFDQLEKLMSARTGDWLGDKVGTHTLTLPSSPPVANMHGFVGFQATALQLTWWASASWTRVPVNLCQTKTRPSVVDPLASVLSVWAETG
jgi:hypothetical protein